MRTPLIRSTKDWYCPECGLRDTTEPTVPNRWHQCPRLRFLNAPLVPVGINARIVLTEREDYVGADAGRVQLDPERQRPVMNMRVERADGSNDTIVYAPVVGVGVRGT